METQLLGRAALSSGGRKEQGQGPVRFRPRVVSARRPHVPCRGLRCGPLSGPGPGSSPASRWSQPRGRRLPSAGPSAPPGCVPASVLRVPRAPGGCAAVTAGPRRGRSPEACAPWRPAPLPLCVSVLCRPLRQGGGGEAPAPQPTLGGGRRQQDQDHVSLREVPHAGVHPLLPPAAQPGER